MNTRENSDEKQEQEISNPSSMETNDSGAPGCGGRLQDDKQEQYRREYLRQLRLRSCPGCGEQELL